jgi:hypothetical protein
MQVWKGTSGKQYYTLYCNIAKYVKKNYDRKTMVENRYIKMRFPQSACENGYCGKPRLQFTISQTGEIGEIQVSNGICDDKNKEHLLPWNPCLPCIPVSGIECLVR